MVVHLELGGGVRPKKLCARVVRLQTSALGKRPLTKCRRANHKEGMWSWKNSVCSAALGKESVWGGKRTGGVLVTTVVSHERKRKKRREKKVIVETGPRPKNPNHESIAGRISRMFGVAGIQSGGGD